MNSRAITVVLRGAVILFIIVALILVIIAAADRSTAETTQLDSYGMQLQTVAQHTGMLFDNDTRVARDLATASIVGGPTNPNAVANVGTLDPARFASALDAQHLGQPEITGGFLFDRTGLIRSSLTTDQDGNLVVQKAPPAGLQRGAQGALGRTLDSMLGDASSAKVVSFNTDKLSLGVPPYGSTFLFQPVTNVHGVRLGVVVLRLDNGPVLSSLFSTSMPGMSGMSNLELVAPPFILSSATPGQVAHGHIALVADATSSQMHDTGIMGPLHPLMSSPISSKDLNGPLHFTLNGVAHIGRAAVVDPSTGLTVIVFDPAPTFGPTLAATLFGPIGLGLFIGYIVMLIALVFYVRGQVEREEFRRLEEIRTRVLTDDIVTISETLHEARSGDLRVTLPVSDSEVGLIAIVINGLLENYSRLVGGILTAVRAAASGTTRVDAQLRAVITAADAQAETMATTATTVARLVTEANGLQGATRRATELAGTSSNSVHAGQEAVSRIGEAVDSIKEAAIGTTREFKRLQEDSVRLTALVSSVKNNAENLDIQAANATLEARHLGTESGFEFSTNIGRLARQAQETLSDAEAAVRSVTGSIDAVNKRIERISEQVRLGVDEVRSVRSTFEDITTANDELVGFIDGVAKTAADQATSADAAAHSIGALAETIADVASRLGDAGDEMAQMRLVIASLGDSVAHLRVDAPEGERNDGEPDRIGLAS